MPSYVGGYTRSPNRTCKRGGSLISGQPRGKTPQYRGEVDSKTSNFRKFQISWRKVRANFRKSPTKSRRISGNVRKPGANLRAKTVRSWRDFKKHTRRAAPHSARTSRRENAKSGPSHQILPQQLRPTRRKKTKQRNSPTCPNISRRNSEHFRSKIHQPATKSGPKPPR